MYTNCLAIQCVHVASTNFSQGRSIRILHTLVNPHNLESNALDMTNKLSEVSNSSRVEEVHNSEVPASGNAAVECVELLLGRGAVSPEPVFDIYAPVDDVCVGDVLG